MFQRIQIQFRHFGDSIMRCHLKRTLTFFFTAMTIFMLVNTVLDMQRPDTVGTGQLFAASNNKMPWVSRKGRRTQSPSFKDGQGHPARAQGARVWPKNRVEIDDRVPAQISYVPEGLRKHNMTKTILVYAGLGGRQRAGSSLFHEHKCPVRQCVLTDNRRKGNKADAVLWQQSVSSPPWRKPARQIWIMYMLESPEHTPHLIQFNNLINWTATYRRDSILVTPYERFVPYPNGKKDPVAVQNYAANKTKKVAWFVSNCGGRNGRMEYVKELQKHIDVDIYGDCGPLNCPRHTSGNQCFKMLQQTYKFYLAFENSNCKDYITEKLYWNAFLNNVVPVVMGARPLDYELSCPPHSFIHVDQFESPKALANYLHTLDKDDSLYNEYFQWKGTGSFVDTKFWCRLCAMLHDDTRNAWYSDINDWWRGGATCVHPGDKKWASWRDWRDLTPKSPEPLQYGPWDLSEGFIPKHVGMTGRPIIRTNKAKPREKTPHAAAKGLQKESKILKHKSFFTQQPKSQSKAARTR